MAWQVKYSHLSFILIPALHVDIPHRSCVVSDNKINIDGLKQSWMLGNSSRTVGEVYYTAAS